VVQAAQGGGAALSALSDDWRGRLVCVVVSNRNDAERPPTQRDHVPGRPSRRCDGAKTTRTRSLFAPPMRRGRRILWPDAGYRAAMATHTAAKWRSRSVHKGVRKSPIDRDDGRLSDLPPAASLEGAGTSPGLLRRRVSPTCSIPADARAGGYGVGRARVRVTGGACSCGH
jgi:hypothetical protein